MDISGIRKRTWAEINLDNIDYNFRSVRRAVNPSVKICCVIKANAYGHGAVELAKEYVALGADYMAVSNIEEALQLRQNSINIPVLVLGYTPPECAGLLSENNIEQCVYSYKYAKALNDCASNCGRQVRIHIKIDSGMGRIGFRYFGSKDDEREASLLSCRMSNLLPVGIFTHFSVSDSGDAEKQYTVSQYNNFMSAVRYLEQNGVKFSVRHCSNSAAIYDYPEFGLDMVRAGIVLYGLMPSDCLKNKPDLKPAMSLKTVISHIKQIRKGDYIGYGKTFRADRNCRIATLAIGYADGLRRSSDSCKIMINNKKALIVGRVCMDQIMADVTGIDCTEGDTATIFGPYRGLDADTLSVFNGTINYETVCNIAQRVPRAYIKNGKTVCWYDSLLK